MSATQLRCDSSSSNTAGGNRSRRRLVSDGVRVALSLGAPDWSNRMRAQDERWVSSLPGCSTR